MSCKGKLGAPQSLGMAMLWQCLIFLSNHLDLEMLLKKKEKLATMSNFLPIWAFCQLTKGRESGAPNENIVQNHINIALLNIL